MFPSILKYKLLLLIILSAFGLSAAFFVGWKARQWSSGSNAVDICHVQPVRTGGYDYINPLMLCDVAGEHEFPEYQSLKNKINNLISTRQRAGEVTAASIYFRDYTAGQWLNIGEHETYAPASLLKVPLLIAYLRHAESHPDILTKKLLYTGGKNYNEGQFYPSTQSLEAGKQYTVAELLRSMIVYSDNNTLNLLNANIDDASLNEVYTDLGLTTPPIPTADRVNFITAKAYAYFFRVLYNATYLSRDMSEAAFGLLRESTFNQGLTAGVPGTVKVAHKFGERTLGNTNPVQRELHDCGMVYYPGRPYLLCIMTKGQEFNTLSEIIEDISRLVYEEVDASAIARKK